MDKRKQYSFFYRIYRRIRYLRYIKKLRKKKRNVLKKKDREEKKQARKKAKEQFITERAEEKLKRRIQKSQERKRQEEIPEEKVIPEIEQLKERNLELLKQEKASEKVKQRRFLRLYFRIVKRNIRNGISRRGFLNFIKGFRQSSSQRKEMFIIALNSLAVFILSFILVFFISQLASAVAATFFDFSTIMHYDANYYMVERDEWYADPVKLIYSAGPVTALFLGLVSLIIFSKIRNDSIYFKLFFFWNYVHGFGFFFGGLLIGSLFSMGFGHAIIWSYIMDTGKLIYSMVALVIMVGTGLLSTRSVLITANSYYKKLDKSNRRRFVNGQILLPFLIGNVILFFFWFPKTSEYFQMIELSIFLILLPVIAVYRAYRELYFEDEAKVIRIMPKTIGIAMGLLILLRILMGIGIPVG